MEIVSTGDNLHEMSKPVSWKKMYKNIIYLSSAELDKRVVLMVNSGVLVVLISNFKWS